MNRQPLNTGVTTGVVGLMRRKALTADWWEALPLKDRPAITQHLDASQGRPGERTLFRVLELWTDPDPRGAVTYAIQHPTQGGFPTIEVAQAAVAFLKRDPIRLLSQDLGLFIQAVTTWEGNTRAPRVTQVEP